MISVDPTSRTRQPDAPTSVSAGWLLALETSSPSGSVALWGPVGAGGQSGLFGHLTLEVPNGHSALMAPAIAHLLDMAGIRARDIGAVALAAGPGSYTGLRIGASLAKGLCAPFDTPLLAMSTLELLAHTYRHLAKAWVSADAWIVPMMDARRQEVFLTAYEPSLEGELLERRPARALIMDHPGDEGLAGWLPLNQPVLLCGSGAPKAVAYLAGHPHARVAPRDLDHLMPSMAGVLAERCARSVPDGAEGYTGSPYRVDLVSFEPAYLKPFMGTRPGGTYEATPAVR